MKFAHWFAAVRLTEGREWVDIYTVNVIGSSHAMTLAHESDAKAGQGWAKDNPVVRLIRLQCEEVEGSTSSVYGGNVFKVEPLSVV